jgi:transcription elongation factor S-II
LHFGRDPSNSTNLCKGFYGSAPILLALVNNNTFTMAMDAKEIELRGKAIGKAVAEGEPSTSILKLLNDLKTGVHATEDLLRSTRIGVTINRLRTHKDPAVQKLATELVAKWRDEVKKKQPPKKDGPAKVATNGSASSPAPPPSGTASPAPSQSKKKHDVPSDKRNHKTDKVKYQVTGNEARDNCVRLMYDGLAFMSEASKYRHLIDSGLC